MTKARKEAQDQLRQQMQDIVSEHLRIHNQRLRESSNAEPPFPEHVIEHDRVKLQGKIEAYRALGFRTDVFN